MNTNNIPINALKEQKRNKYGTVTEQNPHKDECFCPSRAFCCFQSVHPRRCPGLCAFWAFSPLCLTFDTSSKVFPSFYCRFSSVFQKESFCLSKRVLLHSKRSPFEKSPRIFRGNHTALYGFSLVSQSGKHYLCSINNKTVITLKLFGL